MKQRRMTLKMKATKNLKSRSSSLSKITRRVMRGSLLSSRLRRLMKRLLKKLNLRKLMTTRSSPQLQRPTSNWHKKSLKNPLINRAKQIKQKKLNN